MFQPFALNLGIDGLTELQVVLILDTPSTAHITSLIKGFESGAFSKYWGKGPEKKDHALRVVFHLCGNDVFENERYKGFMKRFEGDVHVSASFSGMQWAVLMR
jgi:hypothetical protein